MELGSIGVKRGEGRMAQAFGGSAAQALGEIVERA
jgi:hypothetical protein